MTIISTLKYRITERARLLNMMVWRGYTIQWSEDYLNSRNCGYSIRASIEWANEWCNAEKTWSVAQFD